MYVAHRRKDKKVQPLKEHLEAVAKRASAFAGSFEGEKQAYRAGMLHDIGKYSPDGQRRMNDPENMRKVDHATAGMQTAIQELRDVCVAFSVAGHHGGLPNMGTGSDGRDSGTLWGRKRKELTGGLDYSAWKTEISAEPGRVQPEWLDDKNAFQIQFYTRMLFSCLVDADYLDTEAFMKEELPERGGDSVEILYERLRAYVQPWLECAETGINKKRNEILKGCLCGAEEERGMYTLTVPTGGGKTVSSMAFALSHAAKYDLKRIIYVVPYTSIIEQNADVFERILGQENVLQHHSNVNWTEDENDDESEMQRRKQAASENWDAPVIVTTAVQFFESLYAAKPSRCRKLHNLADSVIVFDEAQMIPLRYLRPCVAAIAELVQHYGVTAVLCTATQPALDEVIREFVPDMQIRELCPQKNEMLEFFRRVHFIWANEISRDEVARRMSQCDQALCIVNTRKAARQMFDLLPEESRFHLSTLMTPCHRSDVLKEIKRRLTEGQKCHVVSTSLIEAGVDVDFPQVWREEAGLDSILQAAGRCNREGKRPQEDCAVYVFSTEDRTLQRIAQNVAAMHSAVRGKDEVDSYEVIQKYFSFLHYLRGKEKLDEKGILELCGKFAFRTISEEFSLIENDTQTIYIPSEENRERLERLKTGGVSRGLLRELGRSAVNVYTEHLEELLAAGRIEVCEGFYILSDESVYSPECGLSTEKDSESALWV